MHRLTLLLLGTWAAVAQAAPDPVYVVHRIEDILREYGVPSASVAVGDRERVMWARNFGPGDERTLYSIASATEPLTATAVMQLVDAGKIELDEPIDDYLGDARLTALVGDARAATLRRVLDHTAGLPWHVSYFPADGTARRPRLDATIARFGKIVMPPGETHRYSNLGYALLERVVEQASGERYEDYLARHVFAPRSLRHSEIATDAPPQARHAPRIGASGQTLPYYDVDHRGASSAWMSASDLVRFGQTHLAARAGRDPALSRASALEMERRQNERLPENDYYALGWAVVEMQGQRTLGHGGSMPGAAAQLLMTVGDAPVVIAVLLNRDALAARREVLIEMLRTWAPSLLAAAPALPADLRQAWRGEVLLDGDRGLPLALSLTNDEVSGALDGRALHLSAPQPVEDGYFDLVAYGAQIPTPEASRHPHSLRFHLKRQGEGFDGYVTAVARPPAGGPGSALSYRVQLRRR